MRSVWPEIPAADRWLPYTEEATAANWHTNFGPTSKRFEQKLHALYGHADETVIATSSATAGLSACLIANGISGPVLCPAFTFQATACAILGAACTPVIIDVDPTNGVVSPECLQQALIETGAKAAIVLAPYGIQTDFATHAEICAKRGAILIIDNAAGLGVDRRGLSPVPYGNHVSEVFSLHATKPFGIGEGGAIFAAPGLDGAIRSAINFGLQTHTGAGHDATPRWGINGKLSEVMAAIGMAVSEDMGARVALRQAMAREWITALGDTGCHIFNTELAKAPWQVFPILLPDESRVLQFSEKMQGLGVEIRRYYQPSLGRCGGMARVGTCENAQNLSERVIVLPVRSWLTPEERSDLMEKTRLCITQCV
ncbi:DegT/DnrJ/EryC1/StrS family aminotransferase [Phaeobacter porticola]|uniref:Putative pyridoxal-phosphate-dependent aminotransferase n=1 Tax=Phaeobacter porticola TaxID=1844006 RepID=A0A1L3I063_9RHOB|nr:DegT/DnrJ/EryC1/StrS family aminotransferase [Phaeobacter porticola]APG45520.1 putative pyridoxal-phosphate-dependent aminotransferase [Phaeobacter porticola]